jgi:pimeloyl-ACP methyl ester carboxylesterase
MYPLAQALSQSYRAIIVDMPGYGRSPVLDGEYTLERAQEAIEQTLLAEGVTDCATVGFSLGAYRALSIALSGRLRVWAVALLAGYATLTESEREGMGVLAAGVRAGALTRELMPARMLSPDFLAKHPEAAEETKAWADATTQRNLADEVDALTRCEDLLPRLAKLSIPLLARVGELDLAVAVTSSEAIAQSCRCTLEVVPHVGHALLIEDFDATLASVRRVLAEGCSHPIAS